MDEDTISMQVKPRRYVGRRRSAPWTPPSYAAYAATVMNLLAAILVSWPTCLLVMIPSTMIAAAYLAQRFRIANYIVTAGADRAMSHGALDEQMAYYRQDGWAA